MVTIHDRGNVTDAANENTSDLVTLQVGWGLNLAMVVLAVVGLVALLGNQDAPGMKVAPAGTTPPVSEPSAVATDQEQTASTTDELERLAALQSRGQLTDEEFQAAKQRLLDG